MEPASLFHAFVSGWGVAGLAALWALKAAVGWVAYRFWKARRKMTGVQK